MEVAMPIGGHSDASLTNQDESTSKAALSGSRLDFESEFEDFLNRELPTDNRVRRFSNTVVSTVTNQRLDYNLDGTINCSDLSYTTLCMISGRPSLDRLTSLTVSVASLNSSDNLSVLSYCTPGLNTLRLDNSRIQSLRVLGDELLSLKTLSVCFCGLEDLDGINYVPNIVNLCAADNQISDVYPITELRRINTLDLENNAFEDYGSISFLFICPKLENLVLRGNPISYESEYRPTIFRILPGLKNLDVITMQRAPRMVCKKDRNPFDDNFDGPSPTVIPTSNDIPKELEEALGDEKSENKNEPPSNPIEDDELIKTLICQKSDDESTKGESSEESEEKEDTAMAIIDDNVDMRDEEVMKTDSIDEIDEAIPLEMEDDSSKAEESVSISLTKSVSSSEEVAPEVAQPEQPNAQQPIIMDKVKPQTPQQSRLLNRRKSLDPVRLREVKQELFGTDELTLKDTNIPTPVAAANNPNPIPESDSCFGFTPNLSKFISTSTANEKMAKHRPDSSMSISSTATSSCYSHSISEADSGIDFETPSKKSGSLSLKTLVETLPKLDSRKGIGVLATPAETPSKRTKRTDKSKLLRTNSDLAGKLTTEGDVEIEDFD